MSEADGSRSQLGVLPGRFSKPGGGVRASIAYGPANVEPGENWTPTDFLSDRAPALGKPIGDF